MHFVFYNAFHNKENKDTDKDPQQKEEKSYEEERIGTGNDFECRDAGRLWRCKRQRKEFFQTQRF